MSGSCGICLHFDDPQMQEALSGLGFFAIDYAEGLACASSTWRSWGYAPEEMLTRRFDSMLDPGNESDVLAGMHDVWSGAIDAYSGIFRILRANGTRSWAKISCRVLSRMDDGTPRLVVGHDQDVDAIKQAELENKLRLAEIETIRKVSDDLSTSLDLQETVTSILEHTRRVIPYDKASVQLLDGEWLKIIGCYGFADTDGTLKLRFKYPEPDSLSTLALQSRKPVVCNDLKHEFPSFYQMPDTKPIRSWLGIPLMANNEVMGLMALDSVEEDFYTLRHQQMAEMVGTHLAMAIEKARLFTDMREMAKTDGLTGIGNRHSLRIQGPMLFEAARRDRKPLTVLMADLDHFKDLNDAYGHDAGDVVLVESARLMASRLRSQDLFVRYGGEEFVVILFDADGDRGVEIAERIRGAFEGHGFSGIPRKVTISLGVYCAVPDQAASLSGYIKEVDKALYQAKERGRNRVVRSGD